MLGAAGGDDAAADAVQLDAAEVLLLGAVARHLCCAFIPLCPRP